MALVRVYKSLTVAALTVIVLGFAWSAAAQATTATVAGSVKDAQGGIIPGATVTLISESRGTTFETQTSATGDFVLSNVPGDSYTVRVAMDGFKTSERKGVAVSPGDRLAVGAVTIEVGTLAETVLVSGEAPVIQAQTGERSYTVTRESIQSLPVTGRNFASFATLTPGVIAAGTGATRADGARTNYLLDGISSVDTGGNQQGLAINPDAIAEVKVIATAYQAEYGRTSGLQISGVTKSGSNQFKGSGFDLERRTIWNANTWANARNGNAKPVADQRDWGYTIGGPVGKPGGKNSLFFFYSEQFSPRKTGGTINRFRVPTALERQGDFSQSTDNNGALFNTIKDSTTGLPCIAGGDTRGCFQDNGVLGKIPQSRLYGLGLNVLNLWPMPNTTGVNFNLQTVAPEVKSNTFQHVIRIDYQVSSRLRLSAKYAGSNAPVFVNPGSIPGFNDAVTKFPANLIPSATVDYTINSSTVFEGTWGLTQGNERAGNGVMVDANTNENAVGLGGFPTLYPNAIVPVGSYQERVLKTMNTPFYVNGRIQLPPQFSWGGRIGGGGTLAPPNTLYNGFLCWQRTNDLALSITKLWGAHTVKAGYQSQDSLKQQNVGTQTAGVLAPEGSVNFGNDSNNPLDTGFGFANAALGVFTSFQQQNALIEGTYVYHNKDFYLQDNWKMTNKLTLDYGMRFTHHGPQYDQVGQASNFYANKWSAASAPLLYAPGCSTPIGATGCVAANRVAVNPITLASLGAGTALAIGTIVPNTGVLLNGIIQQGHNGAPKANYTESGLSLGPRAGAAYDLTGEQKYVLRGSMGYFYDRPQGDSIFGQSGNPPTGQQSTVFNSSLQSIAAGATALQPAPAMITYYNDAEIGSSLNWNGGIQMALPWSSSLDVSYVGAHNYNSIAYGSISTPAGQLPLDRNAPDTGTAYLPQYQDPTAASAIPGAAAMTTDLLRPYRGIGAITTTWPRFHTQYDSLQASYNRRFSHGWQAGFNWTLGLRFTGNTLSPPHLVHNADGSISNATFQAADDALLSDVGLRRHIIKANFVWDLPHVKGDTPLAKVFGAAVNGWQLSGIFTGGSTAPYDATYSYQTNGLNVNLTGSPSYAARIKVVGDPGSGCSKNQYAQFNAAAFQGPTYNSIGNESGTNLLKGCADHTMDLSVQRNVNVGGNRQLQFRLDAFNVFNAIVFNARTTAIQYNNPADPTTIRNNQYNADGTINTARLTPATAGAGAASGAQAMRTVQAQLRFTF